MVFKFLVIGCVFAGEVLAIGAELLASKYANDGHPMLQTFLIFMIPMTLGGALLLLGYMYGYLHLKNIWLITALSVTSILVVEPILAYVLFQQLPTLGAGVGLALGLVGIFAVLVLP